MESARISHGDETLLEFFKVFLVDRSSTHLQIPPSFTRFFNGITPCKVILVDHDGKCWDVKLEEMEGRLIFKDGWQQFAKEKNLEEGDFLVFQYDGKSTFNVKIFSKTGCRKEATPPSRERTVPIVNLEEDSDEPSNKIQSNRTRKPTPKINVKSVLEGACPPSEGALRKSKRLKENRDKQNDKKLAQTKHVPLQNPHFQVYFDGPWKLKKLEFPRKVFNDMNIKLHQNITLRDENDRSWLLSIFSTTGKCNPRHYLGRGWKDFKVSNNIEDGCQCDFQFVVDKANVAKELLVRVVRRV